MKIKNKKVVLVLFLVLILGIVELGIFLGLPAYREHTKKKMEEERKTQEEYYTEFHLSWKQVAEMGWCFGVYTTPKNFMTTNPDDEEWPDYSYCTLEPTNRTEKVVVILTYRMFVKPKYEEEREAGELASKYGLSAENPMTVEWVLKNPAEAVEIMQIANIRGDYHKICSMVDDVYDEIMGTQEEEEAGREE